MLEPQLEDIRLFCTDIDGVWTDGGMYYDGGSAEMKRFNTSDSAGVLLLRLVGIDTVIATGEDTEIVARRGRKLKLEHVFLGVKDKVATVGALLERLGLGFHQIAYIGDDLNDIHLLREAGLSACPANAPDYVAAACDWQLEVAGGDGAYRAFAERYLRACGKLDGAVQRYLDGARAFDQ